MPKHSAAPLLLLGGLAMGASARTIHFDPAYTGSDADGSEARPWRTLDKCFALAQAGDRCLLGPGDYNLATPSGGTLGRVAASGTDMNPIVVEAVRPGSVFIGAWHELDWNPSGRTNIWKGTLRTPLAASIATLQGVWADRQVMAGVRLWYLHQHAALQEATWPRSEGVFPRSAYLANGSTPGGYQLEGLPAGDLTGALAHVFRDEEQGAYTRTVTGRPSANTLGIATRDGDASMSFANHRVWLSRHPNLLTSSDQARWTWDAATGNVLVVSQSDPDESSFVLQLSSAGPDLSGRSDWVFRNLTFMGVVPLTDASSADIRFEGVTFDRPGLSEGFEQLAASNSFMTGLVLQGSGHRVDRSTFSVCPVSCVEATGSGIELRNNTFVYSNTLGVAYAAAVRLQGAYPRAEHNEIREAGGSGVFVNYLAAEAVVGNNVVENWGRLAASRHGGVVAAHNVAFGTVIDSNLILNETPLDPTRVDPRPGAGIHLLFGRNKVLVHHNIVENAVTGIRLGGYYGNANDHSRDNLVLSNTIGDGVRYSWVTSLSATQSHLGTRLANNIFRTQAGCNYDLGGAYIRTFSPNDGLTGGTVDHNLLPTQNPLFLDPNAYAWNFGLGFGSPAIDAGTAISHIHPAGATSWLGAAPDIGAVERGTTWRAGFEPETPVVNAGALALDNTQGWTIPADQPVAISSDRTQGTGAFSVTPAGYKLLQSPALASTAIGGTGFVVLDMLVPVLQANPWYAGAVQLYVECPSRGVWNQWVGQVSLTELANGEWSTQRIPVPGPVAQGLAGATYSDLVLRIAVNTNPGSGNLLLDNVRFVP